MMPSEPPVDFAAATMSLYRLGGVGGVLLQKGENILANHLPYSDRRGQELAGLVRQLIDGYQSVNRTMRQVLFMYDGGSLLVLSHRDIILVILLGPEADMDLASRSGSVFLSENSSRLAFVPAQRTTNNIPDPLAVSNGSRSNGNGNGNGSRGAIVAQAEPAPVRRIEAPVVEVAATTPTAEDLAAWPKIRKLLESVLGKVVGRAQINKLIERTLSDLGIVDPTRMRAGDARSVAFTVMEEIPNRAKRSALKAELESILQEKNL